MSSTPGSFNVVPLSAKLVIGAGVTRYFDFGVDANNWPNKLHVSCSAETDILVLPASDTTPPGAIPAAVDAATCDMLTSGVRGFLRHVLANVVHIFGFEANAGQGNASDGRKRYWHLRSSVAITATVEGAVSFPI